MNLNVFTVQVKRSYIQKSRSITIRTFYNSSILLSSMSSSRRQANKFNRFCIRNFHVSSPVYSPNKIGHARKILDLARTSKPNLTFTPPTNNNAAMVSPTKTSTPADTNTPITKETPAINSTIDLLNRLIPKPVYGSVPHIYNPPPVTVTTEANTVSDIIALLKQAEEYKLIQYEDTKELAQSGAVKLTNEGLQLVNSLHKNATPLESNNYFNTENDCYNYVVVLVTIDPETVITTPIQMHMLVAVNTKTASKVIIGVLTSEDKPEHIMLSKTQPISDNIEKKQFLNPLKYPLVVTSEQFEVLKKANNYVKDLEISNILNKITLEAKKKPLITYSEKGVSKDILRQLIQKKIEKLAAISLASKKKSPNFLTQDKAAKEKKKKDAAEQNQSKQKEDSLKEKEKLSLQKHDLNKSTPTTNIPKDAHTTS